MKKQYKVKRIDFLTHHGILGMRWGKRNGPPYPLDGSDHSAEERKIGWRKSLDGKKNKQLYDRNEAENARKRYWKKKGLSEKKALEKAKINSKNSESDKNDQKKETKINKKLLIGAGITVGALAAAGVIYYNREYVDKIIKSGMSIQTLSMDPDRINNGEAFYAAFRERDKVKYKGLWGAQRNLFGQVLDTKHKITADVAKDLKLASPKNAEKVFNKLLKSNPEFAKHNSSFNYERFNQKALLDNDTYGGDWDLAKKMRNIFYDELKKSGYGGVVDVNDLKYSGYNSVPGIIFDRSGLMNQQVSKLSAQDVKSVEATANKLILVDGLRNPDTIAIGGAYIGGMFMLSGLNDELNKGGSNDKKSKTNKKT